MFGDQEIRKNFSIYKNYQDEHGIPLIYLDSASTSLTPDCVVEAMNDYYTHYRSNLDRSSFGLSLKASSKVQATRVLIAQLIDAESGDDIIFTSGATDSANKIIDMVLECAGRGRVILTSLLEHHSVYVTLEKKCIDKGLQLIYMDINKFGKVDYVALEKIMPEIKPAAVFIQLASNVTGQTVDINKIKEIVKKSEALLICDASQSVGHNKVSVKEFGVDVLFFSGHKMCGPTGIGVLYVEKTLLHKLKPSTYGGGAVQKVNKGEIIFKTGASSFEPGTLNIAGIIGLGKAVEFLQKLTIESVQKHIDQITQYATRELEKIDSIKVLSSTNNVGVISFSVKNVHTHDIEYLLGTSGIAVRAGYHCAEQFTRHLSDVPVTRISFYIYTTKKDIDIFIFELHKIIQKFNK